MQARILLVEADALISKHLVTLIRRHGYSCEAVSSLSAALDALRRDAFGLIILDLDLPGTDPSAIAKELRGIRPEVRLVGLDSVAESRGGGASSPAAFDAVIPKPFVVEPLLAALPCLVPA